MEVQEKTKRDESILTEVFEHDFFNRKELMVKLNGKVEVLSQVGGTIAIHSPFGCGKTWLCDRWVEYLSKAKKVELIAIKIDAFICDYVQDPFEVIHRHFEKILEGDEQLLKKLKAKAISIGKAAFPYVLKTILSSLIGVPPIGENLGEILSNEILKEEDDTLEKIVEQYKASLKKIIKKQQKKVVVFVDELDRCSPKFAINFLEKIKHYFDIEGVAFVLMINKDQIYKAIEKSYGQDIGGAAYLEKFLSLPVIDLPSQHLPSYLQSSNVIHRSSYKCYKKLISEKFLRLDPPNEYWIKCLSELSEHLELNYREHEQALLLSSFYPEGYNLSALDSYFTTMKIKHPSILKGIFEGHMPAHEDALRNLDEIEKMVKEYDIQPNNREVRSTTSTVGLMPFCREIHTVLFTDDKNKIEAGIKFINKMNEKGFSLVVGSDVLVASDQLKSIVRSKIEHLIY